MGVRRPHITNAFRVLGWLAYVPNAERTHRGHAVHHHPLRRCELPKGCGSNIGTQTGTLVHGNLDYNLQSPGGLILTHTQKAGFAPPSPAN